MFYGKIGKYRWLIFLFPKSGGQLHKLTFPNAPRPMDRTREKSASWVSDGLLLTVRLESGTENRPPIDCRALATNHRETTNIILTAIFNGIYAQNHITGTIMMQSFTKRLLRKWEIVYVLLLVTALIRTRRKYFVNNSHYSFLRVL